MKRLFGIVLVAVLLIVAWNAITDSSATACEAVGGAAHAAGKSCPGYLAAAVQDPDWAQEQQDAIRDLRVTTGHYLTSTDSAPHTITSGFDADSESAKTYLRASDDFNYPARGTPNVVNDVETKLAARMRRHGITTAVLAINHLRCARVS